MPAGQPGKAALGQLIALPGALSSTDCASLEVVANAKFACAAIMSAVPVPCQSLRRLVAEATGSCVSGHEVLTADHRSVRERARVLPIALAVPLSINPTMTF